MKRNGSKSTNTATYVGFLRGINVGGHKPIRMDALRKTFESMGFRNVETILTSGNVIFDSPAQNPDVLSRRVGKGLSDEFGHRMEVIIRTAGEIRDLVDSDPFRDVTITPETRLLVTFLPIGASSSLKLPYESPEKDMKILSASEGEVCSVIRLSPTRGTTDLMKFLENEFGRQITTRTWNTVVKVNEKLA